MNIRYLDCYLLLRPTAQNMCLFIYVFLLHRGAEPPAGLINAASVLAPLGVTAATRPRRIR